MTVCRIRPRARGGLALATNMCDGLAYVVALPRHQQSPPGAKFHALCASEPADGISGGVLRSCVGILQADLKCANDIASQIHIAFPCSKTYCDFMQIQLQNHTVSPATRQKWTHHTQPQPDGLVFDLPSPDGWKAELTYVVGYIRKWFIAERILQSTMMDACM